MTRLKSPLLMTSMLAAALWAGAAMADDMAAGKMMKPAEASRDMGAMAPAAKGQGQAMRMRSADAANRALPDEAARIEAYGVVKRSRDGSETHMDAAPGVAKAIRDGMGGARQPAGSGKAEDRADASREVIGRDTREQVADTTVYPFDTVGFIEGKHKGTDQTYDCTAALIGPKLVLTAAQCIYDHELEGGWMENVTFWPGLNGADNMPFGAYQWADAYVLNGYITEYDGSYDSVWPYDLALVVLDKPAGDDLGWLGYTTLEDGKDSIVNTIGYQADKEAFTQWRTDCNVKAADLREYDFTHDCDAAQWSTGAPMYLYLEDDSRRIVGLNMGSYGDANWAIRIDDPIFEWIQSINQ